MDKEAWCVVFAIEAYRICIYEACGLAAESLTCLKINAEHEEGQIAGYFEGSLNYFW